MTYPATGPNTTARPIRPTDADAMILRLFRRRFHPGTIHTLYGAIVAQARRPEFYEEIGAADTVEGRFDMIVLHLVLVLRRIEREPQGAALGRALVDAFGRDMDHNLREMGVGDLAVPKQMKRMMEAFHGRARSYAGALCGADPTALEQALARNVFGGDGAPGAARLAAYVRRAAGQLDATQGAQFLRGGLAFPDPRAILAGNVDST
jgi:cytochrome b pre-mRNA-processing protein 3